MRTRNVARPRPGNDPDRSLVSQVSLVRGVVALSCALGMAAVGVLTIAGLGSAAKPRLAGAASKQVLACERTKKICNLAAWRRLPLRHADGAGQVLLTESQAIAALGWHPGDTVGAVELTYGQAHHAYPGLAASAVTNPARQVWVVTLRLAKPVIDNEEGIALPGWKPPLISAFTVVIDAATGHETDWCAGCATIPASPAATRLASTAVLRGR